MTEYPNWFDITAKENFDKYLPKDRPLRILQVGVFTGDATVWMLENLNIKELTDVDTWQGSDEQVHKEMDFDDVYQTYLSRVLKYTDLDNEFDAVKMSSDCKVAIHRMTSDEFFASQLETTPLDTSYVHLNYEGDYDFIYIDGDHTALQVLMDGLHAFRLLAQGGIIAFDDLAWQHESGEFCSPKLGIESFYHLVKDKVDVLAQNSQFWVQKR